MLEMYSVCNTSLTFALPDLKQGALPLNEGDVCHVNAFLLMSLMNEIYTSIHIHPHL